LFRRRHPRRTALLIGNLACNGLSTVSTAFKRKCHFSSTDPCLILSHLRPPWQWRFFANERAQATWWLKCEFRSRV
jgi:hypothetical protein